MSSSEEEDRDESDDEASWDTHSGSGGGSGSESGSSETESEEDTSRFKAMSIDDAELHVEELFHKGSSHFMKGTAYATALVYMRLAAARGHADAKWVLDMTERWLAAGRELPSTKEEVRELFETDLDSPQGLCFSAWLWHDEDPQIAFARYKEAANRFNYFRAIARCGFCYDKGAGVQLDVDTACKFYKRAADLNHPVGAYNYACCLENGEGVEKNVHHAIFYYSKACAMHYSPAAYNLGCLYGNAKLQDVHDEAKAEHYFRLAARLGDMWGAYGLAVLLERRKTPDSFAEGAYWMARSAEFKDRMARRVIVETRVARAYNVQRSERAVFWYGRVLALGAFDVPLRVWGRRCDADSYSACVAATRAYQFIMYSVRRAVVYWILAATRELGLIKDVAVLIAKRVFAMRSEGGWWSRESPFEGLPTSILQEIFRRLNCVSDWNALARTCTRFAMVTSFQGTGEDLFDSLLESFGAGHARPMSLVQRIECMYKVKLCRSPDAQPQEVFIAVTAGVLIVAQSNCTGQRYFDAGMANERFRIARAGAGKGDAQMDLVLAEGYGKRVFVAEFDSNTSRNFAGISFNLNSSGSEWFASDPYQFPLK